MVMQSYTPELANVWSQRIRSKMVAEECPKDKARFPLLAMPNEIIFQVFASLSPRDLRYLRESNRRLHYLAEDQLCRLNGKSFSMPNALILKVAQRLSIRDCSRLARASHKFYPIIMNHILRTNVQEGGSSLINFSAMKNLVAMARKLLEHGADVNSHYGVGLRNLGRRINPLLLAARHGHLGMVNLLLKFGASHFTSKRCTPLLAAIGGGHEHVALVLIQALDSVGAPLDVISTTPLQMASTLRMTHLVQYLLRRKATSEEERKRDMSNALYKVLLQNMSEKELFKRELHQDVYEIVLMLLENGADPDASPGPNICFDKRELSSLHTARSISSRHPDPRVRTLLMKKRQLEMSKGHGIQVGRAWLDPFLTDTIIHQRASSMDTNIGGSCRAKLIDLLERSTAKSLTYKGDNKLAQTPDLYWNSREHEFEPLRTMETQEPPLLSSFPPLSNLRMVKQYENGTGKEVWAYLFQRTHTPSTTGPRGTTTANRDADGREKVGNKELKKRKKKWKPLEI